MVTYPVGPRHGRQTAGRVTKFSNSMQARVPGQTRQTTWKPFFRRLHKRATFWRVRACVREHGRRAPPLDGTNLVMVPSDGVLGTGREELTQRLRDPMRAI